MVCFKYMSVLKIIPGIGNSEDIILMGSQIVVWILHLTEVEQVTHILLSSTFLSPSHLPIFTLSSPSELVGTPLSGDGPPTQEWVLTGSQHPDRRYPVKST